MEQIKQPKSLVEQTHDILLDAICSGKLEPGQRLNQDELAARLNVSRQPVISAISVLKANGFVEDNGRRGVVVAGLSEDQFVSVYEFRKGMEPFAVELACARIPKTAEREAHAMLRRGRKLVGSDDTSAQVLIDMEFHQMIYRWTGNSAIISTMRLHWQHIRRAMSLVVRQGVATQRSWEEHEKIVAAVLASNPDEATREMHQHIDRAMSATLETLRKSEIVPVASDADDSSELENRSSFP